MGAQSTYYSREGFQLDANTKLTGTIANLGVDLSSLRTIRVVILDATVVQAAGAGTAATIVLQHTVSTPFLTITSADLADVDENGVYITHVRGALLPDGVTDVRYVYTAGTAGGGTAGAITGFSVYIDAVENVG